MEEQLPVEGGIPLDDVPSPPSLPVNERMCRQEAVWFSQNVLLGEKNDLDDIVEAIAKIRRCVA